MTLNYRFSPTLEFQLFQNDQALASLRCTIHKSGLDLFEGFTPHDVRTFDHTASGTYFLAEGESLTLNITAVSEDPQFVNLRFSIVNSGNKPVTLDRFTAPTMHLDRGVFPPHKPLWTMQGAAVH